MKIRGQDSWGHGAYNAPRDGGKRRHKGADYVNHFGEAVAAFEGGEVTKIGFPYSQKSAKKRHFRLVELRITPAIVHRYFYVESFVQPGEMVAKGQIIGWAQDLDKVYPGIVQHVHFEIKKNGRFINPAEYLENVVI